MRRKTEGIEAIIRIWKSWSCAFSSQRKWKQGGKRRGGRFSAGDDENYVRLGLDFRSRRISRTDADLNRSQCARAFAVGALASTIDVFIMRGGSGEVGTRFTATNQVLATLKRTKLFLSEMEAARGLVGHVIHHWWSRRARDSRREQTRWL